MDDLYLAGMSFLSLSSYTLLRALVVALGIADEVDRLGLKGSKKKKSKKLDEDWMVSVSWNHLSHASTERPVFTAHTQATGSQRGAKGHSSYAADPEPQSPCQVTHSDKGQTLRWLSWGFS